MQTHRPAGRIAMCLYTGSPASRYETPFSDDAHNYEGKFATALDLLQSFTAEWMKHYGYGRQTFYLEFDERGKVIVHVVKGERPAEWYRYDIGDYGNLYGTIACEVERALPKAPSIECVLIGFSNIDRQARMSSCVSVGYSASAFSMLSPAERNSSTVCTVMRVPSMTGGPLRMSGWMMI